MRKTKKALASLAIAGMVLSMAPMSVFAATTQDSATNRIYGADRVETAVKVAQAGWTTAATVIVAPSTDANLVDALAAAPLAGQEKAPILLTDGAGLDAKTKQEIVNLKATKVYAVGALSDQVVKDLQGISGVTVEALKGADRIETATKIAAKLTAPKGSFVVGYNALADALSVASYAAANDYEILVANPDGSLPSTEKTTGTSYVLGGPTLVKDVAGANRIYGADRFETNQKVLANLSYSYDKVYVANGNNEHLVDSLVASSLAAQAKAPIALSDGQSVKAAADLASKMNANTQAIALGGTSVVSDSVLNSVKYAVPATLEVESVKALNGKEIQVTFNKPAAKDSLINPSNYTASFTTGSGLSLDTDTDNYVASDDRTSVIIPIVGGNLSNGQGYKVDVKDLVDDNYKAMTDYKDSWNLFNDTAAPVLKSAAKKSGKLRLYFDEPVRTNMTVKVDGIVQTGGIAAATTAGDYYVNVTTDSDSLDTGNHTVLVYNATDWSGATGNVAPLQSVNYTVSDDTTAPSVVSVTPDGGNSFKVKFSETLSNITTSNFVVKKGNATIVTSGAQQDADDSTVWDVTVAGTSDVALYDTNASTTTLSVAVKNYYDGANLYGAEYDANITLTKDTTGPVIISDAFNSATSGALTLKFNEDLATDYTFDASKITVVKDNVLKQVDGATVSGKTLVLNMHDAVTDGSYSVQLAKGTVEDESGNDNLALSTSVTFSATNGTAYYGIGSITVSQSGTANIITIPYQTKMTASAVDTTNYQLDGMPLPIGSSAYFTDTNQNTVAIKLPSGTIDSTQQRLLAFSKNIQTDDGRVIMTSSKNQLTATISGFVDNVAPVLTGAKFVISNLSDTTTQQIRLTFSENMTASNDPDDFKVSVNGIKVAVSSVVDGTAGDKYLTLQLATPINMSQSVTVEVVKAADQNDSTTLTKDMSNNALTEGTVVNVADKTTSL